MPGPLQKALWLCLAGLLAAGPAWSEEEQGRRFSWRPSIEVRAIGDDNVYLTASKKESDFGFGVRPRVELDYRGKAYELGADVGADLLTWIDHGDLDQTFFRVNAHGEAGLLPGLTVRVENSYVPHPVLLGLPQDSSSNLVQTNRTEAELRYWRELGGRREMSAGVLGARFISEGFGETEVEPLVPDVPFLPPQPSATPADAPPFHANYWEGGGYLELQNDIGRRSAAYIQGRVRYRSYDEAPDSDHIEYGGLLGFRMYWLKNFELDIAGGYGLLDFRSGRSVPRILGQGDIRYRAGGGWHFRLGVHNKFTADLEGNDFMDTTGRLVVEKYFNSRTVASLTGFVSYLDNEATTPRGNLFGGVEVKLRRQLSRHLQLVVSYRYWQNGGSYAADDFQQNRAVVSLGYWR